MAASTWFQGSACPPANHGIMPSANCTAAMDSTVAATSAMSRMPETSGRGTHGLLVLGRVHDEALADEGVEKALEQAYGPGAGSEVPDQEAMVEAGQESLVPAHPDCALQPPVRSVEGVGVVGPADGETGAGQPLPHLAGPVDADVAPFVAVVLLGEGPADALGEPAGDGDGHGAAGAQDAGQLGHDGAVVGDVLENFGGDD